MDLLLTPLLNRVLRKFIRSSSEGAGSELRVSLSSRGTLTLHNLELCLDLLLEGVGFLSVSRAFARKLQVTVPWTGLTTQPIQVCGAGALGKHRLPRGPLRPLRTREWRGTVAPPVDEKDAAARPMKSTCLCVLCRWCWTLWSWSSGPAT